MGFYFLFFSVYFIQKKKTCDNVQPREILKELKMAGTPVDESLVIALTDTFPGPKLEKGGRTLDLAGMYVLIIRFYIFTKFLPK